METSNKRPVNPSLRDALEAFKLKHNLNNQQMASKIRVAGPTQVSKYLNDNVDWDASEWECAARDMLRMSVKMEEQTATLFENNVSAQVARICEHIRKTSDFGGAYGDAGIGKTSGINLYAKKHPSTIFETVDQTTGTATGIIQLLFAASDKQNYDNRTNRGQWLMQRYKGSERLIILDNAHKILTSGWSWLFDFYDATNAPIAYFGNRELLTVLDGNEQWFSRAYFCEEIEKPEPREAARRLIAQFAPEAKELQAQAEDVALERGALRSLGKQLKLTARLSGEGFKGSVSDAFKSAGTFSLRRHTKKGVAK